MPGSPRPHIPKSSIAPARRPTLHTAAAFVFSLTAFSLTAGAAHAEADAPPITVEADQFSVYLADEKAVWRGNVTATQGNYTFRTSQLTVHLDDLVTREDNQAESNPETSEQQQEAAIELSADRVTYDIDRDEIQGLGNSELRRGIEYIRADNIVYEVGTRIARAQPDAGGRVRVQFLSAPGQPLFPRGPLTAAAGAGG